jgi:hypothetical protein
MEGGAYTCVGLEKNDLYELCAKTFGKGFEKKIGANVGQISKDSTDHRINAEFAIFNREHIPDSILKSALYKGNVQRGGQYSKIPVIVLYAIKAIPRGAEIFSTCPSAPIEKMEQLQFTDDRLSYGLYSYKNFGHVSVRHSSIQEAGWGLFSETDFYPYEVISNYAGEIYPYHPLGDIRTSDDYNFNIGVIEGGIYLCRGLPLPELCSRLCKMFGPAFNEKKGMNSAQLCNDPRDNRINAEFFVCARDDVPEDIMRNVTCFHIVNGKEVFIQTPIISLYALKYIPAGTEIFASYGTKYW